jgi:hypothetical protein
VPAPLPDPVRPAFRAAARAFVPETTDADAAAWARLEALVAEALAARPPAVRRQIVLLIRVLDLLALLRHGRRLARLDPERRAAFLEAVGNGPVLALRRGVWGLRTLVMLGWYGQPAVQRAIGYRADPAGWDARR